MSRIGMNPARHKKSTYRPARVTIAMLVYLPHLSGYFKHRFDVVKLSLESIFKNTRTPYDLLVFDNASCAEVKVHLQKLVDAGKIRYLLTSSENIGKLGALHLISASAPGEVLAYTDDDTFFYPGWLEAHLRILDAFPKVGMVSGSPERTLFDHGIESNIKFADADPSTTLVYAKTIPESWEQEWAISLGKDPREFLGEIRKLDDITLERNGLQVYATACHNQFVSPLEVARRFLQAEWTGRLMGGMNALDNAIDSAGYLRLTTHERTTRLIGNLVSPTLAAEAQTYSIDIVKAVDVKSRTSKILQWKPVRWMLQGIYNRLFGLLSGETGGWYEAADEENASGGIG